MGLLGDSSMVVNGGTGAVRLDEASRLIGWAREAAE
jgi:hypothetical protein